MACLTRIFTLYDRPLPSHGTWQPDVGPIESVPYTMAYTQNQVIYPRPYFGEQDTFTFRANDYGTPHPAEIPTLPQSPLPSITKLTLNMEQIPTPI